MKYVDEGIVYALNTFDFEPEFDQNGDFKVRPELFTNFDFSKNGDLSRNISFFLKSNIIPNFVGKLDDLEVIPTSRNFSTLMHDEGINIRYLGYIAHLAQTPHI